MSFINISKNCPSNTNQRGFTSSQLEVSELNAIQTFSIVKHSQQESFTQPMHLCFKVVLVNTNKLTNQASSIGDKARECGMHDRTTPTTTLALPGRPHESQTVDKMEMRVNLLSALSSQT